jgi:hypothetical protein
MIFSSEREFKIWDYNVSHNQLLLRSPASPIVDHNIDIVFWRVRFLLIPSTFFGIEMDLAFKGDVDAIEQIAGKLPDPSGLYSLASGGRRFFVFAGGFKVLRNDLDIFVSTLYYFSGENPENVGEVLAHS